MSIICNFLFNFFDNLLLLNFSPNFLAENWKYVNVLKVFINLA